MDSANNFNVVRIGGLRTGEGIRFQPFALSEELCHLSRDSALNLAVWLALMADPEGHDFVRLYNEIKGPKREA